ncbi:MAG: hypothetical protein ABIS20_12295 [Thermoanaerobaculia bacterium]
MSRILFRRITTATALAALLTLAAPAQAAGWNGWAPDGDLLHSAWQWVASFWIPQAPAHPSGRIPGVKSDRGSSVDPNGGTASSTPPCCERSGGIDPNG